MPAGDAPFKILVLDEADHLTTDAQHSLRRTMEAHARSCRIILICNYSSRIIPPIQSRCAIFRFPKLDEKAILGRLQFIAKKEKVALQTNGKDAILYLAEGDMRAAINLLQAASSISQNVDDVAVFSISGRANPRIVIEMLDITCSGRYNESLNILKDLIYNQGVSPVDLARQMHREILRLELPANKKMSILEHAAEIEYRIGEGASGEIQLASLLAYIGME